MPAKRKNLNLLEKLRLIKESKAKSQRNVASQLGISVGAVNSILKRKREYENLGEENYNLNVKRLKRSTNEDVNELTWQWFVTTRSKNIIVSGPIIQAKGLELASQQNLPEFKASNGWPERFRNRCNIRFKILSGESAGVNPEMVASWKEQLESVINDYSMDDI